jgi:Tfp pilus assembly major pilin PilA
VSVDPQGDGVVATLNDIKFPANGEVIVEEQVVTATLAEGITAESDMIPLTAGGADNLPSFGLVVIEGEEISYSGITDDTLIVAARGTTPAAHASGTAVTVPTRVPACSATAEITNLNKEVVFSFLPDGCTPDTDCLGVRAIVIALDNLDEITNPTSIYRCTAKTDQSEGEFTLECPVVGGACDSNDDCETTETCNTTAGTCVPNAPFQPAQSGDSPLSEGQVGNLPTTCSAGVVSVGNACLGDCDGNGRVTPGELLIGLDIQLDVRDLSECTAMDGNNSGTVTPGELLTALDFQLNDCPGQ